MFRADLPNICVYSQYKYIYSYIVIFIVIYPHINLATAFCSKYVLKVHCLAYLRLVYFRLIGG